MAINHSKRSDWGTAAIGQVISKKHHDIYPAIDASKAKLPKPCVACIGGASRGIEASVAFSYAKAGATALVLALRRMSGPEETAKFART
jgi:hypothetical protein